LTIDTYTPTKEEPKQSEQISSNPFLDEPNFTEDELSKIKEKLHWTQDHNSNLIAVTKFVNENTFPEYKVAQVYGLLDLTQLSYDSLLFMSKVKALVSHHSDKVVAALVTALKNERKELEHERSKSFERSTQQQAVTWTSQ
jgi:hypothetical protein